MRTCCFSRYQRVIRLEELQFASGRDMCHMQSCPTLARQFHCQRRTPPASLLASYLGMMNHVGVISVFSLCLRHIGIYHCRVLTMSHYGQSGNTEHLFKCLPSVNKHIASRGTHKEFYSWHCMPVNGIEDIDIAISGTDEESIVHHTLLGASLHLVLPCLNSGSLGHGVGHVKIGCHSSSRGSHTLGCDIGLVGHSRFAEMHMIVNYSR